MEDQLASSVDLASKETTAPTTAENKSDIISTNDVDASLNDEGKMFDKEMQHEDKEMVSNKNHLEMCI